MIPTWIFEYIRCPITNQKLQIADDSDFDKLRRALQEGRLKNRLGEPVKELAESGMVDECHQWFYPIVNDIPTLIADEAVSLVG